MKSKYAPKQADSGGEIVKVNGIDMYYVEYGEGKPLVLLHGFGGSSQNWYPFAPELAERFRLIIIDMRGHGYSTNPNSLFSHRESAVDVLHLLDRLGIDTFSAMGISSGGMVLLHMATLQAGRIDSMVLVSATTHFPKQAREIMRRASFSTMPQEVRDMYTVCAKRGEEQVHQLIAQFNALHSSIDDVNFSEQQLSAITARTLIVHGDRDNFFPVEIPVAMYRSIPNSALWIIPNGDHVPVYDNSVPFTATVLGFLCGDVG